MRLVAGFWLAVACVFTAAPAAADQGPYPKTEAEVRAAYDALHWQNAPGSYKLPASHAVIQLPSGEAVLLGAEAERYSWLSSGTEFPGTEAVLSDSSGNAEVYYEWRDEGYVSDSDWEDVDGDELLAQYREGAKASNDERIANGFEPLEVVGWLEPPRYDKVSQTVTYALELKNKNGNWTNAVALRLGRAGYTEFTWVGPIDLFKSASGRPALLDKALATHSFEDGYRYQDFKEGDKVAAYGIAGLVATALGVKFGKGLIAALIAFAIAGKKIIIPAVIIAGAGLLKFGRRLFGRGQSGS
jgi:uncharacterized membrane-anchored protein